MYRKSQNLLKTITKCWVTLCPCEENANDCQIWRWHSFTQSISKMKSTALRSDGVSGMHLSGNCRIKSMKWLHSWEADVLVLTHKRPLERATVPTDPSVRPIKTSGICLYCYRLEPNYNLSWDICSSLTNPLLFSSLSVLTSLWSMG